MHIVSKSTKLTDLLHDNSHLFKEELREIKQDEENLQICPEACPLFFRVLPVLTIKSELTRNFTNWKLVNRLPLLSQFQKGMEIPYLY